MRKEQIITTTNNNQMEEKGMKQRFIQFKKKFVPALSGAVMGVMLMSTTCFAAGGTSAVRKDCRHQIQQHKHIRFLPRPFRCLFSPDPLPQYSQHHKSPQHQRSIPEKQIFCISYHHQLVLHIQR